MLALAVLALMLLGLSALFLRLLASSQKSNDQTSGLMLAERILRDRVDARQFGSTPTPGVVLLYTHDAQTPVEFTYQVTSTEVSGHEYFPDSIYYLDVQVSWMGGQRGGQGMLRARAGRMVTP